MHCCHVSGSYWVERYAICLYCRVATGNRYCVCLCRTLENKNLIVLIVARFGCLSWWFPTFFVLPNFKILFLDFKQLHVATWRRLEKLSLSFINPPLIFFRGPGFTLPLLPHKNQIVPPAILLCWDKVMLLKLTARRSFLEDYLCNHQWALVWHSSCFIILICQIVWNIAVYLK